MAVQADVRDSDPSQVQLGADLMKLASYSEPGPGVTRVAWTDPCMEACEWLAGRMRREGLDAGVDEAGNVIGMLEGGGADAAGAIVVGSHIDTVPEGGRYDGALGIVAGLTVAHELGSEREALTRPVWIAAFMDEEGVRFGTSFFGSRAFAGEPLPALDRTDEAGVSIAQAMERGGREPTRAADARRIDAVGAYLELHVEQGPTLEETGHDLGIVTAIVGRRAYKVRLRGQAAHAGTTPRSHRRDALRGAAEVAAALHSEFDRQRESAMNIGRIAASPGAINVVPGAASLEIELRSATADAIDRAEERMRRCARAVTERGGLSCEIELRDAVEPVECDSHLARLLEQAAAEQGASTTRLASGAGHDALIMARHVPSAMLMVPSRGGLSHAPDEWTDMEHCVQGAHVLTGAVRKLALNSYGMT